PARSCATRRSSSVIALAIHVTSWCATSPRSAVTRPPPPRRATRLPASSRPKVTGPRLETTISLRRATGRTVSASRRADALGACRDRDELGTRALVAREPVEEREQVTQQAWRQEVPTHEVLASKRAALRLDGVVQDRHACLGTPLRGIDEPARDAVFDLRDDAADAARDHRPPLPERLGDRQ